MRRARSNVKTKYATMYRDAIVAQQRGRNDAWRVLAARNLDRHEERPEREHEERHVQRNDRIERDSRPWEMQTKKRGEVDASGDEQPVAHGVHHARNHQVERYGDKRE